jgi:DNA adenine methylase
VRIECRDALDVIRAYDDEDAVFYLDPPYHPDTHEGEGLYRVEGGAEHLEALVEVLLGLRGQAVLSGYDHELFAVLERRGWERYGKDWASSTGNAAQDRERRRTEVLWVHRRTRQLTLTSAVPG